MRSKLKNLLPCMLASKLAFIFGTYPLHIREKSSGEKKRITSDVQGP